MITRDTIRISADLAQHLRATAASRRAGVHRFAEQLLRTALGLPPQPRPRPAARRPS